MKVLSINLLLEDAQKAKTLFCEDLFFEDMGENTLTNHNCTLRLQQQKGRLRQENAANMTYVGLEHIALETADIEKALQYCKQKQLHLETNDGNAFYNPLVWGTGMYYFNILTDFGVKVEVSQRLDRKARAQEPLICGLEHLGVQVADIGTSVQYYQSLGFEQPYPTVTIQNGSTVYCAMLESGDFTVELYEFADCANATARGTDPLGSLTLAGVSEQVAEKIAPNGEVFEFVA